ncbi:MAG: hypothetical protein JWO05_2774 [Gemmatimonadetes bacterium]|nr:hypothetical protein [Gemmatimonadota bacterium]
MSAAYFPVIEGVHADNAPNVDGKALARASSLLESLASAAGVKPLTQFASMGGDEFGIFRDLGIEAPPDQWFTATEGLATVRALRSAVGDVGNAALLADLEALEGVLVSAERGGQRWHLAMDI